MAKNTWFTMKAATSADAPDVITLHGNIGGWGITAQDFLDQLKTMKSKDVNMTIHSNGGSLMDGLAIANGVKAHVTNTGGKLHTKVLGVAASAATLPLLQGDTRSAPENAFVMVHRPSANASGNTDDLDSVSSALKTFGESVEAFYVERTGQTAAAISDMMKGAGTWMSATKAKALGFLTELTPAVKVTNDVINLDDLPDDIRMAIEASNKVIDKEMPVSDKSFSAQAHAIALEAGMTDYLPTWLLDANLTTISMVEAAVKEGREVQDLCQMVKQPEMAKELIMKRTPLADARKEIAAKLAAAADGNSANNTQPANKNTTTGDGAGNVVQLNASAIYEARAKKMRGEK